MMSADEMDVVVVGSGFGGSISATGKKGYTTPTGMFTILQKKVSHESSIYKGAQMPHMQRLTWTGIAIEPKSSGDRPEISSVHLKTAFTLEAGEYFSVFR
jgi:hypothetical protein